MGTALLAMTLAMTPGMAAAPATIDIDLSKRGPKVSKDLYGIFFEEINHAGDGGVLAELLENNGFSQGANNAAAPHWSADKGESRLDPSQRLNEGRSRSLWFNGRVSNGGFWGVPLKDGAKYRLEVWVKGKGELRAGFRGGLRTVGKLTNDWKKHKVELTAEETNAKGRLLLEVAGGEAWLGFSSLRPLDTWNRSFIRKDLGNLIAELKPAFFRFPGGCFVEGQDFDRMWDWKKSIGPKEARPGKDWRFWGYSCTDGLGFHEYLEWCEKMGAEALFVANCGMTHGPVAPMSEMGRFVQDALDAIEYAIGPTTSKWGALRAKNGHPKPFPLRYVQIGNENGGPLYDERYALMAKAINAKYPQIELIACVWGGVPQSYPLHIIDEHYYSNPGFFWQQMNRYDTYDRKGPKVYVGEYAVTQQSGQGNLAAALGEAAFMTGMERNSDIVVMASYAPLLSNINRKQWNPNAIVFNNHQSYGTPSYWVQRMFAQNRADVVVPSVAKTDTPTARISGEVGLQTWRTSAEFKDLKVTVDGKETSIGNFRPQRGRWTFDGNAATQTDLGEDLRAIATGAGLDKAERFTIELKAKKNGGIEGFIVMFGVGGPVPMQWNLGGWGNETHAFQYGGGGPQSGVPGKIETGRWYDIKIEGVGDTIQGYLDGKLINQIKVQPIADFAQVVGIDEKKKELVVKIVNGGLAARPVQLNFSSGKVAKTGTVYVMTGPDMDAENTFEEPEKMASRKQPLQLINGNTYLAPARSVNILRMKLQ